MYRTLKQGPLEPDHPDFTAVLEAIRDIHLMEFVFDQLEGCVDADVLGAMVSRAVQDSLLPEQDRQRSAGRDTVCEMYVAAVCAKAAMMPVFDEPDIRCEAGGRRNGIAVKRVKSEDGSQIEKHIRKASRQIENSGLPGHIALDISMALNRDNGRLMGVGDAELTQAHHQARWKYFDDYYRRIKDWVGGREDRSVILLDHFVRQHPDDGWGFQCFTDFIPLSPDNQRRWCEAEAFRKQFIKGLATPPTSSRP